MKRAISVILLLVFLLFFLVFVLSGCCVKHSYVQEDWGEFKCTNPFYYKVCVHCGDKRSFEVALHSNQHSYQHIKTKVENSCSVAYTVVCLVCGDIASAYTYEQHSNQIVLVDDLTIPDYYCCKNCGLVTEYDEGLKIPLSSNSLEALNGNTFARSYFISGAMEDPKTLSFTKPIGNEEWELIDIIFDYSDGTSKMAKNSTSWSKSLCPCKCVKDYNPDPFFSSLKICDYFYPKQGVSIVNISFSFNKITTH